MTGRSSDLPLLQQLGSSTQLSLEMFQHHLRNNLCGPPSACDQGGSWSAMALVANMALLDLQALPAFYNSCGR